MKRDRVSLCVASLVFIPSWCPSVLAVQAQNVRLAVVSRDVAVVYDARVSDVTLTAVNTTEGLVLIDALSSPDAAREAIELLRRWNDKPVRYLILTHPHGDHVWGAQVFEGAIRLASRATAELIVEDIESWKREQVSRLDTIVTRLAGRISNDSVTNALRRIERSIVADLAIIDNVDVDRARPEVLLDGDAELQVGEYDFHLLHIVLGHTAADLAVFVPAASLLVTGDLVFANQIPYIAGTAAGSLAPLLAVHERLLASAEGTADVIPGHGGAAGIELIQNRQRYLSDLQRRVREGRAAGWTLDEAKERILMEDFAEFSGYGVFHFLNIEVAWREQR